MGKGGRGTAGAGESKGTGKLNKRFALNIRNHLVEAFVYNLLIILYLWYNSKEHHGRRSRVD